MDVSKEKPVEKSYRSRFLFLVVLIVLIWIATPHYVIYLSGVYKTENPGIFGDMFGTTNTLFSGLAFLGVIWAVFLQTKELGTQRKALKANIAELELQREELRLTREEIKGQKEQLERQNETLTQQAFDARFFEYLRLHNDIVARMKYGASTDRIIFVEFIRQFAGACESRKEKDRFVSDRENNAIKSLRNGSLWKQLEQYLGNVRCILQLIYSSSTINKEECVQNFRSQLSVDECFLIYYICKYGDNDFKIRDLVSELKLLQDFDIMYLRDPASADSALLGQS